MFIKKSNLSSLIRGLMFEISGDYNQTQIESYRRGEKSLQKMNLNTFKFRALSGIAKMNYVQFSDRQNSIGCYWGDLDMNIEGYEDPKEMYMGDYTDEDLGNVDGDSSQISADDISTFSKEEWNKKIRETNKLLSSGGAKYTAVQVGDDLFYLPLLFYKNKLVFIYGPIDESRINVVSYNQLYTSTGVLNVKDSFHSKNIPTMPSNLTGNSKDIWTPEFYHKKISRDDVPFSSVFEDSQRYMQHIVSRFLEGNKRRFKKGIVTDIREPKQPEQLSSPAMPSGAVEMVKPGRPAFIDPVGYRFTLEYDEDDGIYYPTEPYSANAVDLIRWANAEETKEELDAILGTGSYVVNDDGTVILLDPID